MKLNVFHLGFTVLFSLAIGLFLGSEIGGSVNKTITPSLIQSVVKAYNPTISESQSLQIAYSLDLWIVARNLSFRTSLAIVAHESRFDPEALGGADDKGLWQLNEKALRELEVEASSFCVDCRYGNKCFQDGITYCIEEIEKCQKLPRIHKLYWQAKSKSISAIAPLIIYQGERR